MKTIARFFLLFLSACVWAYHPADAQQNIAQQAYGIFEQNCLNCHGEHGAFTEAIIIEHTALIETGAVVPRKPGASELYQRLIEKRVERRMPLGQPPLTPAAVGTIRRWIQAGAPNWSDTPESDSPFITPKEMLESIEKHVNSLAPFDRTYARYFTMTHLYNAGERAEALHAYQRALSKLVNSLSWGREVTIPQAIDPEETIFYIDLRDYEWEIGTNRWTQIEQMYPYSIAFNAPTQTNLHEKLTDLREAMNCEVPFVHVDWFLATASLPPLYHDILDLPATDRELEDRLEVNVVENLRNAAGSASGVRVSTIQVCRIITVLSNATSLGMERIGKVMTLRGVLTHSISLPIHSLSRTTAVRLSSTSQMVCKRTISPMPVEDGSMPHR